MSWQYTPFTFPLLLSGVLCGAVAIYGTIHLHRHGDDRTVFAFTVMTAIASVLALNYGVTLSHETFQVQRAGLMVSDLVVLTLPIAWLVFALEYSGRGKWITSRSLAALAVAPTLFATTIVTDGLGYHSLQYIDIYLESAGSGYYYLERELGQLYVVAAAYSYVLILAGAVVLVRTALTREDIYRGQAAALILGALAPMGANVVFMMPIGPENVNPTKVAFAVTATCFWVAIFRYQLLHVIPIARDTAVDNMREGYLVLDDTNQIVDINPRGATILDLNPATAVGQPVETVLADYPDVYESYEAVTHLSEEIEVTVDGQTEIYSVQVSPLTDSHGLQKGRLVLFHDVTEQRRRQAELERQNEQLEGFASVVSHDLRNPLTVARGYADLAADSGDVSHLEKVESAHDRMEHIIDDLLTLARQGQAVGDPESVSLRTAAEDAWNHVDTADAGLVVETDATIQADPDRLLQLFENCIRNAIEHADPSVIRVGILDTGFYVEDDGPGIPAEKRETVFEHGFTTNDGGTGFGLSIVKTIASAHSWDVAATAGTDGGARFEVTGADVRSAPEEDGQPTPTQPTVGTGSESLS